MDPTHHTPKRWRLIQALLCGGIAVGLLGICLLPDPERSFDKDFYSLSRYSALQEADALESREYPKATPAPVLTNAAALKITSGSASISAIR